MLSSINIHLKERFVKSFTKTIDNAFIRVYHMGTKAMSNGESYEKKGWDLQLLALPSGLSTI